MLVNMSTLLLQFEKCIVDDMCDGGRGAFFHFPPAGSTNKRVGKVCRLSYPIRKPRCAQEVVTHRKLAGTQALLQPKYGTETLL